MSSEFIQWALKSLTSFMGHLYRLKPNTEHNQPKVRFTESSVWAWLGSVAAQKNVYRPNSVWLRLGLFHLGFEPNPALGATVLGENKAGASPWDEVNLCVST